MLEAEEEISTTEIWEDIAGYMERLDVETVLPSDRCGGFRALLTPVKCLEAFVSGKAFNDGDRILDDIENLKMRHLTDVQRLKTVAGKIQYA